MEKSSLRLGTDLVFMPRLDKFLLNHAFLAKIFTRSEFEHYQTFTSRDRRLEFLAGRIAAKEAYMKSIEQGIDKVAFNALEVVIEESGATTIEGVPVSISHDGEYCIAVVAYEG